MLTQRLSEPSKVKLKVVGIVLVLATAVYCGFDEHTASVDTCYATSKSYITAEFSETYSETYTYSCGNNMLCTGIRNNTRYWSKPASNVYKANTVNGKLMPQDINLKHSFKDGIYTPETPPLTVDYSGDFDFDSYKVHVDIGAATVFTDNTEVNLSSNDYLSCLLKIGEEVTVNTWYGMQYSAKY